MKITLWGVAVFLLLRFDGDNKFEGPVGTTAINVTSRANNRTIATPTIHILPLNRETNFAGDAVPLLANRGCFLKVGVKSVKFLLESVSGMVL